MGYVCTHSQPFVIGEHCSVPSYCNVSTIKLPLRFSYAAALLQNCTVNRGLASEPYQIMRLFQGLCLYQAGSQVVHLKTLDFARFSCKSAHPRVC